MKKNLRLDKWLSSQGFGSRTATQLLIRKGDVVVDEAIVTSPALKVDPTAQRIFVKGQEVKGALHRTLMLYKPAGVLTAATDHKQPTVMDLLPSFYLDNHCMPIGRLDKDTTGLLLFTTNGTLAHYLLSPKRQVAKVYEARVQGLLTDEDIEAFSAGMNLGDFVSLPAQLCVISIQNGESLARVILHEGKYHQVKRMFQAVGKPVLSLHRCCFGSVSLDPALSPGEYRGLTLEEVQSLWEDVGKGEHDHE